MAELKDKLVRLESLGDLKDFVSEKLVSEDNKISEVKEDVNTLKQDIAALQDLGLFVKDGIVYDKWEEK